MKQTVQKLDNFINENKNLWVLLKVNWMMKILKY